jgi:hypothetical protein
MRAPATAARCPLLLRAVGPPVAYRVTALASVPPASGVAAAAADAARWLSTAEAAASLGITPNGVRDLLRRGRLAGRRDESRGGPAWQVSAASVRERLRRAAA